jgi:hypothetical protein
MIAFPALMLIASYAAAACFAGKGWTDTYQGAEA